MSDKNGNELWDIFLVSPQTGEVTNLTASPDSADEAPAWSPDSQLVAYMTKDKTSPSFEIEIIDIASRLTTHVTRNSPPQLGNVSPLWSPDGRNARLHPGERQRQGFQHLPLRPRNQLRHQPHAPLRRPDLSTPPPSRPTARPCWSPATPPMVTTTWPCSTLPRRSSPGSPPTSGRCTPAASRPTASAVVWSANVDGREALYSRAVSGGDVHRLPTPRGRQCLRRQHLRPCSRDGQRLLYYHSGAKTPNDLYVFDLKIEAIHPAHQLFCRRTQLRPAWSRRRWFTTPAMTANSPSPPGHMSPTTSSAIRSIRPSFTSTEAPPRSPWTASTASSST